MTKIQAWQASRAGYVVTQEGEGRVLFGTQTEDRDGFSVDAWTAQKWSATVFADRLDAEDDANVRHTRGHYLAGYVLRVRALAADVAYLSYI
jgi:hypothetical protein